MPLLRYAASGVLRNRRRTLSAILGVLLAVTFIAGTFIAIDSSARSALDSLLSQIPGDFTYSAMLNGAGNGSDYRDAIAAIPGIQDVSLYSSITTNVNLSVRSWVYIQLYGILPTHLGQLWRDAGVTGSLDLSNGTVAVDSNLASSAGLKIGDSIQFINSYYGPAGLQNYTANLTIAAIYTTRSSTSPYGYPYVYYSQNAAVNIRDFFWVLHELNLTYSSQGVSGEIWTVRDRFVNPYDAAATSFNLARLGRQIESALATTGAIYPQVTDQISPLMQAYNGMMTLQRVLFLLLSMPVILLGLYLGAVGVDLGHAERRRELAVLKTRGAGVWQITGLLILEAVLGGVLAAVLGLAAGTLLSRLLLGVMTPAGVSYAPGYTDLFLSVDTVVSVVILSILFMGIVSYRSARRTAGLPLGETLRYYAPGETRLKYSPTWDLVLLGYGIAAYVVVALTGSSQGSFFTMFILFIFVVSMPVVPLLLAVAVTRLATRATGRVYGWASRAWRPVSKNLEFVVARNLVRNPRRASNVAIIIALGLAFGLFVVSSLSSQQAYIQRQIWASTGADVAVDGPSLPDATFAQNVTAVPGVVAVTHVLNVPGLASADGEAPVVALDPATYFSVSHPESSFFDPSNPTQAYGALATNGEVLVTSTYAQDLGYTPGDTLVLTGNYYDPSNGTYIPVRVTTHIGAIVRFLPGTAGSYYFALTGPAPKYVYASFGTLASVLAVVQRSQSGPFYYSSVDRYLVSLAPGTDWHPVKTALFSIGASNVAVYQEQLDQALNNPFTGAALGFIKMEIAFIVVILTVGLALIIYAASLERDVEFAGIIARGASGWQTASLLVGEAFSIMLIGLVAGAGIGLLTSALFVQYAFGGGAQGAMSAVPYLFVFPVEGLLLLVVAPAAMLLAALGVSWRTARMNVARVLKMRGG